MSYTKLTDFAVKDSLLSGNAAKVIRGTEIDAEFNALVADSALKDSSIAGKAPLDGVGTSGTWPISISGSAASTVNVTGTVAIANGGTGAATQAAAQAALGITQDFAEVSVASGATTNIGAAASSNILITGTTTITAFDTVQAGIVRKVRFQSALTLTYNATSLILPTAASIAVAAGDCAEFESLGSGNWVCRSYLKATGASLVGGGGSVQIQPIGASVGSNALTVGLNPTTLDFRSSSLTNGVPNTRSNGSAISLVVPSGATLGTVSAQQARLVLIAIDNAGTIELAIVNLAGGNNLDETTLISTTAISAAATSASVVYSTTARTNVPFRVVGFIDITEATAGTWATDATLKQGMGGQSLTAMSSLGYGQTWQNVTGSRVIATTYYNTTGRSISVSCFLNGGSGGYALGTVNGVNIPGQQANAAGSVVLYVTFVVPPGGSYSATISTSPTSVNAWQELR